MGIDSSVLGPWCVNIVSQEMSSGRQLALAVNLDSPTGQAVMAPLDPEQPSQLWLPLLFSFFTSNPMQYATAPVFINLLSGLALTYPGSGDNAPVQQSPLLQLSTGSPWNIVSDGSSWAAVQAATNGDENWSIATAGINAPVFTTNWGGGPTSWNTWGCIYPTLPDYTDVNARLAALLPNLPRTIIQDQDGVVLSDNGAASQNIVIEDQSYGTASQQWLAVVSWKGDPAGGFNDQVVSFLNVATGNAMQYGGLEAPLASCPFASNDHSGNFTWTYAQTFIFPIIFAVRPACDENQNINITENRTNPGQYVSTWTWGDGDPASYDSWSFISVTPSGQQFVPASQAALHAHTDMPQRLSDPSQLVPPLGATWGSAKSSTNYTTSTMSWSDDSAMGSATQSGSASLQNQFYVYWVDGVSTPYYIVVLRQTTGFAPGSLLARQQGSYGFFQYLTRVVNTVADGNGNPFASGVSALLDYSPKAFTPAPQQNPPVCINEPMVLLTAQSGRKVPTQFNASDTETISLPDWGIADGTQGIVQALTFHQATGWDPTAKPPSAWPTYYLDLFDGSDNVTSPPAASAGSLKLVVLSAWSFAVLNPGAEPPSFPVQFSTTLGQSLAALHNPSACKTVITGSGMFPMIAGAHHILDAENAYSPYVTTLDLGVIVTQPNDAVVVYPREPPAEWASHRPG